MTNSTYPRLHLVPALDAASPVMPAAAGVDAGRSGTLTSPLEALAKPTGPSADGLSPTDTTPEASSSERGDTPPAPCEYDLLLRHLRKWMPFPEHRLDDSALVAALRAHAADGHDATSWPRGSARRAVKDLDVGMESAAVQALGVYWRFLRETGRLSPATARPQLLLNEAGVVLRARTSAG